MQPLASLQALADPIYEAFYGLKEQPFAITTDPKFFYLSASHLRALQELIGGLRRREAILLLTGETGTGKTTMCRTVIRALGERTSAAMILNPYMTGPEIFRVILRDFGAIDADELQRGALATADLSQLIDRLETFLNDQSEGHAIVVLDEAQSMAPAVLDQIRLLAAFERDGQRLVQIIVCGQPSLHTALKSEALHAFNERITRRVLLAPLPTAEVEAYIQHRLQVAGGTDTVRFDADAARMIAELSRGLPRRVNVLCDRALQEGRVDGATLITRDLIKRAAKSLAGLPPVAPTAPATSPAARTPAARPLPPPAPSVAAPPAYAPPAPAPMSPPAAAPRSAAAPPAPSIFAQPIFAPPDAAPAPVAPVPAAAAASPFSVHVSAPADSGPAVPPLDSAPVVPQPSTPPGAVPEPASVFASTASAAPPIARSPVPPLPAAPPVAEAVAAPASVFGQFASPAAAPPAAVAPPADMPLVRVPVAPAPVVPAPSPAAPTPATGPLFAPGHPADAATLQPTLTLSQSLDPDETITSDRKSRVGMFVGGTIVAVASILYVLYAQHILAIGPSVPGLPPAPDKSIGIPAGPLPVPSDDEVQLMLNTMKFFNTGGSGQFPDNRH